MRDYKALLLDLDGTLLDIEVSFFLGPMVEAMHGFFSDTLEREKFREGLFGGTQAIMENPRSNGETNREEFYRVFSDFTGLDAVEAEKRFLDFYEQVFPLLRSFARPARGGAEFVTSAAGKGYVLALATNPIFPVTATIERVRWAGLDPGLFRIIPGLENMSSCKPSVRYYHDVAEIIGVDTSKCLMVGTDVEQDMPASDAGMDTYLVEGNIISRGIWDREPDDRGSLEELAEKLGF
jgi:FMN phosphatase YigB (HAD superfamily)